MHRRLKIKLLIVYLISVLPFLIFIFYLCDLWYDTRRAHVLAENINYARLAGEFTKDSLAKGELVSKIISTDPYFYTILLKNRVTADDFLRKAVNNNVNEIDNINILDLNGNILATTADLSKEENITLQNRAYFEEAIKTKKTAVSPSLVNRSTGKKVAMVATPVIKNDEVAAVIIATLDLEHLKSAMENIFNKKNQPVLKNTIILLDNEGRAVFVTQQPFPKEEEDKLLADTSLFIEARHGETHLIENQFLPLIKQRVVGVSVPVNNYGWVVVSVAETKEIFASLLTIQSIIWIITITGLLFAGSLFSFFLRKVKIAF
ncbi:MAG: hypothetical protein ACD_24C00446G0002 [uncultured bacterium]|nr:MAG: hypothetical protein ACD_24C00446G0002 [uncultured bacterium]